MLILAIDSATPVAGVALLNEEKLIKEEFSNYKKTHSETLMVMVDRVLRECQCTIGQVDAFAVTIGPGSFTGLRIGLAAVKGLSMATGKPVTGVSTLDTLAYNLWGSDALVCPLLDARKQEVYCGFYDVTDAVPYALSENLACSPAEFTAKARDMAREKKKDCIILLGDGYYPYADFFQQQLGNSLQIPPPHLMLPRAAALGSLGLKKAHKGEFEDIFKLRPVYIRLSEAEYRLGRGEL
ncbi:MAG: tRNA (adenosine(37)-N6)-threonylcarbamoyltransferase complex dimerization subunit type 1 TsaB [Syntrophomonadaceae bacterium]|nr:tRNA (adenosine(37)-N6)-threonylcarbamoyltransferase complex dimerization subunit type 1 TsaB [Syntrophomonadaceae bacterium]MDD3271557.1 tRNA (adenosine(37)-N6)-threonylcarbamoyltransferase complex dimerization subunit type 1 TsaB [Syntrophomonadaceae bacterium]MDD3898377.1 tRNA (adenosine(37)-N6)-threonylcarbamoyltransferase complex dimerization subunit type 1 TsaB [Syntrophomonadaceae bacterium]MDD4561684.1 tRNA (adenosine(37)-N6)-threonylcarbamoyltransferase complex dimerization subunit t